jgi:hypothetical protein
MWVTVNNVVIHDVRGPAGSTLTACSSVLQLQLTYDMETWLPLGLHFDSWGCCLSGVYWLMTHAARFMKRVGRRWNEGAPADAAVALPRDLRVVVVSTCLRTGADCSRYVLTTCRHT